MLTGASYYISDGTAVSFTLHNLSRARRMLFVVDNFEGTFFIAIISDDIYYYVHIIKRPK